MYINMHKGLFEIDVIVIMESFNPIQELRYSFNL